MTQKVAEAEPKTTKEHLTKERIRELIKAPGEYRDKQNADGLGLRVGVGGKASWFVEFYFGGKHYNSSLGRVPKTPNKGKPLPEMQLDDARDKAHAFRLDIQNPAGVAEKVTLRDAFEEYVRTKKRRLGDNSVNLTESTQASYLALFNQHLLPYENRDYRSITEKEWRAIYAMVEKGKTATGEVVMLRPMMRKMKDGTLRQVKPARPSKGSVTGGYKLFSALSGMYELNRAENPIKVLRKQNTFSHPPLSRTGWVRPDELQAFVTAVRALNSTIARDALLTVLLTDFRIDLVLGMRKDRLDCDAYTYLVKTEDIGNKRAPTQLFPLNRWLVENVLRPRKEHSARPHPIFMFPALSGKKETTSSLATSMNQLEVAFGRRIISNDLRRTFTTVADLVGTKGSQLERLTGHASATSPDEKVSKVVDGYIMTDTELLRPALNRITNTILELSGVLPIGGRTRLYLADEDPALLATLQALAINAKAA
jgi:hypothetical protein